jgi:predicted transcriptional regulator
MESWSDVRGSITSLTNEEKNELDFIAEIVSKIIKRRAELNISQRSLAEKSGIKQSAIARLEKLNVIPRIDTLERVLKPLGLRVEIVLDKSNVCY